jgi:post-segregation antitoxin (ccd killing protein)
MRRDAEAAAKADGVNISEWVRRAIQERLERLGR